MFSIVLKCFSWFTKKKASREIKLVMLGLDNAGKSTIINDLKGEPKERTIPTVGFSSVDLKFLNFKVTAYDVGGGPRIRGIWKDYYAEVFGMVYVVDASDLNRTAESRAALREALSDSRLAGKPFVLFANKQDLVGALTEADIELQFELEQLARKCKSPYKVFQCTAFMNDGKKIDSQLKKGLTWLLQTMKEDFSSLSDRVQKEVEIQKEADRKEKAKRFERVRKAREERERAEREAEANRKEESVESEDDDVVFGNVLPRVQDVSKTKTRKGKERENRRKQETEETEEDGVETSKTPEPSCKTEDLRQSEIDQESLQENIPHQMDVNSTEVKKKKKKKKRRTRRNQTAPAPTPVPGEEDDSDRGVVLKPIAWRAPPPNLNGFAGGGRKLEPIRPPLHNNLYSPSTTSPITEEDDEGKLGSGSVYTSSRPRPNGEDSEVMT